MHVRRRDDGLTLAEVLIVIAVLGIIIGPLTGALIVYLRNTDDISRRLTESHDAQISAAYFTQDVQSIGVRDWTAYPYPLKQSVEVNVAAAAGLYPCGDGATPEAVVRLAWDDPQTASGTPQVVRVAYVVQTVGGERQLRRITCAGSATPTSVLVLAHNLDPSESQPVTVACSSSCTAAPAVPLRVTLTVRIKDSTSTGTQLAIVLSGERRQT